MTTARNILDSLQSIDETATESWYAFRSNAQDSARRMEEQIDIENPEFFGTPGPTNAPIDRDSVELMVQPMVVEMELKAEGMGNFPNQFITDPWDEEY